MADLGEQLVIYLETKSAITDLVGSGDDARIFPGPLPQGASLPAITYFVVDSPSVEDLSGSSGLAHSRVQIDCYAETRIGANTLAEKVRLAPLQGHRGAMAGIFVNGVSLEGNRRDFNFKPSDKSNKYTYGRSQDFVIDHEEATS